MTSDDIDALLIEAHGRIQQGAPGVLVSTDEPLLLRQRLYPRMKALGIEVKIKIPPQPMSLHILPRGNE